MLGLAEQIGGDHDRVGRLVGDDQDLGRPGDEVDADRAEELALGLGDVGVAGTDEHVDAVDRLGAKGQRGKRLHAAEHVDLVGAGKLHRGDRGVGQPPVQRRRAGRHAPDAGDLRRDDAHVRGGDHGVAAARHVRTDALDRDVAVTEPHAGERLDLEVEQRRALRLGEPAHLLLAELDVVDHLCGDAGDAGCDLVGVEPEVRRRPAVEPLRVLPDRRVTSIADGGEDLIDHRLNGGVGAGSRLRPHGSFEGDHTRLSRPVTTYA